MHTTPCPKTPKTVGSRYINIINVYKVPNYLIKIKENEI